MRLPESEDGIQSRIVEALEVLKYEVMVTSRRRKKCPNCGSYAQGGDGVTKGLGDLLVRRREWPWWIRVEADVKSAKGTLKPEQKIRFEEGSLLIWRDHEEAIRDMETVCQRVKEELG